MSKRYYYGGQAVMEGVMMRGQRQMAVAVRQPGRPHRALQRTARSWVYRSPVRNWPFVRGVFVLWDALLLGMRRADALRQCRLQRGSGTCPGGESGQGGGAGMAGPALWATVGGVAALRRGALLRAAAAAHPLPRPLDRVAPSSATWSKG